MAERGNRFEDLDRRGGAAVANYLDAVSALDSNRVDYLDEALRDRPEASVLDVGCGVGNRLLGLAQMGHRGALVGVDISEKITSSARARAAEAGLAVRFTTGDAARLELAETFDVVHAERLLIHVADLEPALRRLAAHVKPGGRLILAEPHASMFGINTPDIDTTTAVLSQSHRTLRNPWVAMRIPAALRRLGLRDVRTRAWVGMADDLASFDGMLKMAAWSAHAVRAGLISSAAEAGWWRQLREVDKDGEFLGSWVMFSTEGRA